MIRDEAEPPEGLDKIAKFVLSAVLFELLRVIAWAKGRRTSPALPEFIQPWVGSTLNRHC
jgi:hypothetical protein